MGDDLLQEILTVDPDAALRQAMAAKQNVRTVNAEVHRRPVTNQSIPQDVPRRNPPPTPRHPTAPRPKQSSSARRRSGEVQTRAPPNGVIDDNLSESNFSCRSIPLGGSHPLQAQEPTLLSGLNQVNNDDNMSESNFSCRTEISSQPESVFKVPMDAISMDFHMRMRKQVMAEAQNACREIEKHNATKAEVYYKFAIKKLASIRHFVISAHDPSMNELFMQTSMMNNTMDMSQLSNARGFMGSQASLVGGTVFNDSLRSNNTFLNSNSHLVSSTTGVLSQNAGSHNGTFLPPQGSVGKSNFTGSQASFNGGNVYNESLRPNNTVLNNNHSHLISSTTAAASENTASLNGTFLPPRAPAMRPSNPKPQPNQSSQTAAQNDFNKTSDPVANSSQVRGGSFLAPSTNSASSRPLPTAVVSLKKYSLEKRPSPLAKSSPLNESVQTSPINQNNTMNSTMNSTMNRTASQRRKFDVNPIILKNWTLALGKRVGSDDYELLVRGVIAKKCEFGNANMEHTTQAVKARLGEFCVKTKDGREYQLQGPFQNLNYSVPKIVTSLHLKRGSGIPTHWRKMVKFWGASRPRGKNAVNEDGTETSVDDPLNTTVTRMKSKEKAKISKQASPVKRLVSKPPRPSISKHPMKPTRESSAISDKIAVSKHFSSRPSVNPIGKIAQAPALISKTSKPDYHKIQRKRLEQMHAARLQDSSALDSSVNSPAEARGKKSQAAKLRDGSVLDSSVDSPVQARGKKRQAAKLQDGSALDSSVDSPVQARGKKRHRPVDLPKKSSSPTVPVQLKSKQKPSHKYWADRLSGSSRSYSPAVPRPKVKSRQRPQVVEESSINTSVDVSQVKPTKKRPIPRYLDENDISLSGAEKNKSNFTNNSNISFEIVSPGKTLHNIKKLKDSNIINSQVTPPTSYFLNVLPNSDKKSEKIERTKKTVKRLNERVLKKGRTATNIQNVAPKLTSQDPKGLKKYIHESNARLTKIQQSRSMSQDEMSDFSDVSMSGFLDD
nr:PREDICTED: uncharacterized protein LOC109037599 isoform X1 [Bemisia tabaci]